MAKGADLIRHNRRAATYHHTRRRFWCVYLASVQISSQLILVLASAPGPPGNNCPKPPSNKDLVPASSRSTSPDLDYHITQPNLEAVVTWDDDRSRPRHTLDLAFGLHIDTSNRTALFLLHHHTSNPPCLPNSPSASSSTPNISYSSGL